MNSYKLRTIFIALLLIMVGGSCKKSVEIDPSRNEILRVSVFTSDKTALAAMSGVYSSIVSSNGFSGSINSVSVLTALSADELKAQSTSLDFFERNALVSDNAIVKSALWSPIYNYIYQINAILEGLEQSTSLSVDLKTQLTGEARFLRAFCYFYLVNIFGKVPLTTATDYRENRILPRSEIADVYKQITDDLIAAKPLLPVDYSTYGNKRVRIIRPAVSALLARVYLYQQKWADAETEASIVIGNTALFNLENLDNVFLSTSKEAILQLMPVSAGYNSYDANVHYIAPNMFPVQISLQKELVESFESTDKRLAKWVNLSTVAGPPVAKNYYAYKYKLPYNAAVTPASATEYTTVLRLAEQYLIRAEARLQQDKLLGANSAESDINAIRGRADLLNTTATTKPTLLQAIEDERRHELFTEWGHRWFDLKRMPSLSGAASRADDILGQLKGNTNWQPTDVLYPLPATELLNNPALKPQNNGY